MDKKATDKEAIIAEYLTGNISYRKLRIKYEINFRLVHSWVMKYQGKKRKNTPKPKEQKMDEALLSNDVKQLQQELRKVQLHNKLLNAIIDIAEE